ncbi:MAG TPA: VOC family protein, partial [Chloroflexia bacterium]|nr:VOC family protein [Chloroflexia bacterium]
MELTGLHHVSALTAQAPRNLDFYTRLLGLRLVKKTVNQDDTSSYHLFYGDERGTPGTELTFFDIPDAAPTRPGRSSISRIALRVPGRAALAYWRDRFAAAGVDQDPLAEEGGRAVLAFRDFEGQRLALIDDSVAQVPGGVPWAQSST